MLSSGIPRPRMTGLRKLGAKMVRARPRLSSPKRVASFMGHFTQLEASGLLVRSPQATCSIGAMAVPKDDGSPWCRLPWGKSTLRAGGDGDAAYRGIRTRVGSGGRGVYARQDSGALSHTAAGIGPGAVSPLARLVYRGLFAVAHKTVFFKAEIRPGHVASHKAILFKTWATVFGRSNKTGPDFV